MALRGSTKLEHRLEQMLMMLMVTMRKEEVPSFFSSETDSARNFECDLLGTCRSRRFLRRRLPQQAIVYCFITVLPIIPRSPGQHSYGENSVEEKPFY